MVLYAADQGLLQRDVHEPYGRHRRLHADVSLVADDCDLPARRHDWRLLSRIPGRPHRQVRYSTTLYF